MLREATQMVGVVPNAAYRHFASRDELLAAVGAAAMRELAGRADLPRIESVQVGSSASLRYVLVSGP